MPTISKKHRDMAMRIICDHFASTQEVTHINSKYLIYKGFPRDVDVHEVIDVLQSMGYIDKEWVPGIDEPCFRLTDKGRCYFEREADEAAATKKKNQHDWRIAIFSAFAGAILSRPFWGIVDSVIAFFTAQP